MWISTLYFLRGSFLTAPFLSFPILYICNIILTTYFNQDIKKSSLRNFLLDVINHTHLDLKLRNLRFNNAGTTLYYLPFCFVIFQSSTKVYMHVPCS